MRAQNEIFVAGRWQKPESAAVITVVNPTTEEPYGTIPDCNEADVARAVEAAARALRDDPWRDMPVEERSAIVRAIQAGLAARADEFAELSSRTLGQPIHEARGLGGSIELIDMYLESLNEIRFGYLRTDRSGTSYITRRPVGVVAGITPWNTPLRSEVKKAIPALLAGCTVVLKSAPETPFAGAIFAEVCATAGVPDGVLNVVFGGPATGAALVAHPLVRKVAFTGSTATGALIGAVAGASFKRMQLELGGKSAAVVLEDADLAAALPYLARGNFYGTGQMCVAVSRVLVPRRRYAEVVDALVESARAEVVGDPLADTTTMGPLVTERQRGRVLDYFALARSEGARVAIGGGVPEELDRGWFVSPTVLDGVDNSMRIAHIEAFGPVASVIPYSDEGEAIDIANSSEYGLHGAVFAADDQRALDVARRIETGSLGINRFGTTTSAPFGGVKNSGIGREHGPEGYDSFLEYVPYTVSAELADRLRGDGVPG
jgi:aldehyde dehydrogenase (NAD+)